LLTLFFPYIILCEYNIITICKLFECDKSISYVFFIHVLNCIFRLLIIFEQNKSHTTWFFLYINTEFDAIGNIAICFEETLNFVLATLIGHSFDHNSYLVTIFKVFSSLNYLFLLGSSLNNLYLLGFSSLDNLYLLGWEGSCWYFCDKRSNGAVSGWKSTVFDQGIELWLTW